MDNQDIPMNERQQVEAKFLRLFSGDSYAIGEVIAQLQNLESASGIRSFMTPIGWGISLSDGQEITGRDSHLLDAVTSILGNIAMLVKDASRTDLKVSMRVVSDPRALVRGANSLRAEAN